MFIHTDKQLFAKRLKQEKNENLSPNLLPMNDFDASHMPKRY